ncbi:hypothetical protein Q604_UNBc4C00276G0002, partial [human gut metagenome]
YEPFFDNEEIRLSEKIDKWLDAC